MEKEFIPYEQALALKELGFDEPCFAGYSKPDEFGSHLCLMNILSDGLLQNPEDEDCECLALLYQQAFKWFREKHMLRGDVQHADSNGAYKWVIWKWNHDNDIGKWERISFPQSYASYEEAEVACLEKLIETVKENPTT